MAFIRFTDRPAFRNPWLEFERIRQGLDELAHSYTDQDRGRVHANVYPALNVFEETDKMVITAEMPGVKPEDLEVSLQGDTLTVQGRRTSQNEEGIQSFHRREMESGSFSRALSLPVKVDPGRIEARLANGILTMTLMKAVEATPRQIRVQTA